MAGVLVLLTLVWSVAPAGAHSSPIKESTPRHESVVTQVDDVSITFTGAVRPDFATFSLRSADGRTHPMAEPRFSGADTKVQLTPSPQLGEGLYRVGYQVVFDDGHSTAGVVQFEISADGVARAGTWPSGDDGPVRPEPERLDVSGVIWWIVGGAVLVSVAFVVIMLWVRAASGRRPGSGDPDADGSVPPPTPG
ncbi:MAG: copper resistance protein CopC [Propionibacteriales bacterium]|nr:copper resistance protein CopC [Propionibacteriales bacterium]